MALELRDFKARTKTIVLDYDGEKIEVRFRPARLSADWLEGLASDDNPSAMIDSVIKKFCEVVEWWDVVDHGEPYAVTEANLRPLEISFLQAVMTECAGALRVDPQKSSSSRGRSR